MRTTLIIIIRNALLKYLYLNANCKIVLQNMKMMLHGKHTQRISDIVLNYIPTNDLVCLLFIAL